jgi:hypothetical protein
LSWNLRVRCCASMASPELKRPSLHIAC